jgi:hypothetical protein
LNDCFNILNGLFPKERITKYSLEKKKHKLQKFLHVLDVTEQIANAPKRDKKQTPDNISMFDTTFGSLEASCRQFHRFD